MKSTSTSFSHGTEHSAWYESNFIWPLQAQQLINQLLLIIESGNISSGLTIWEGDLLQVSQLVHCKDEFVALQVETDGQVLGQVRRQGFLCGIK